jgi:hypothetical protein
MKMAGYVTSYQHVTLTLQGTTPVLQRGEVVKFSTVFAGLRKLNVECRIAEAER